MRSDAVDWADEYAATMTDATSLRHMRRFALDCLRKDARIRQEVVDSAGEEFAVVEWDSVFEVDKVANERAVRLIEARLDELGLTYD